FLIATQCQFAHYLVEAYQRLLGGAVDEAVTIISAGCAPNVAALFQDAQELPGLPFGIVEPEHALGPEFLGPEGDNSFDHFQARRIGSGLRPTHLADYRLNFGEAPQQRITVLEVIRCLGDAYPRGGDRHVHQSLLIQRRDELDADFAPFRAVG